MMDTNNSYFSVLLFYRLAEENQVDPGGPFTYWHLRLIEKPVPLG